MRRRAYFTVLPILLVPFGGGVSCNGFGPTVPSLSAGAAGASGYGEYGGSGGDVIPEGGAGGAFTLPAGKGIGAACSPTETCRPGLACTGDRCVPGASLAVGGACVIAAECQDALQCVARTCVPAGTGKIGDPCQADTSCAKGFRCALAGLSARCAPEGTADIGGACTSSISCYAGLACGESVCVPPPAGLPAFGLPLWKGETCAVQSPDNVQAYFEVPGAKVPEGRPGDFFRLPFPNDARLRGGKVDLTGFPTPGTALLGVDPVKLYVDAISASETGWGASPTVLFRFSGPIAGDSFNYKDNKAPVRWIDVTAGPSSGGNAGVRWTISGNGGKYLCPDWFGVRRPDGAPLEPGHSYAVWLTTDGNDSQGRPITRSAQLAAILGATAPADTTLAAVYGGPGYQLFRAYLKKEKIDPATILNATVFTVGPVRDPVQRLAAAVDAEPVPAVSGWKKCGSGVVSPCPQAEGTRACGPNTDPAYDEYHALVRLPIFQQGTAPYVTPADGGDLASAPVRREDVCLALTVPKGTPPTAGWPLVVYAHGTGGSFRDHVRPAVAGALANVTLPDASTVKLAVLGIDQVAHGPRRGASLASPDELFYNFLNPKAARGNPLQGAADQLSLARLGSALTLPASVAGGTAVAFDPASLVFFGHSQGAGEGSIALPYANTYLGAVLSGNGAGLIDSLLNKAKPTNIAAALPFVLLDVDNQQKLAGGDMHPVLSLLQQWSDPADPLNFAVLTGAAPLEGKRAKHVFQTYGLGDSFSPPKTMRNYALAARLGLVAADVSANPPDPIESLTPLAVPASGNVTTGGKPYTLAVREYGPPAGRDGHFVVYDVPTATADVARFLAFAATGRVPVVGK